MNFKKTREISIGPLRVGGNNPIRVQSMTNTKTHVQTLEQVLKLQQSGCEIIRLSVPNKEQLASFIEVKKQAIVPLVADIHYDHELALECLKNGADCVRINPGNIGGADNTAKVINAAKEYKKAIRIGINSGSLEKEILQKYGSPTSEALVESALKWINFAEKECDFKNFKVSIKTSNVEELIKANELLSKKTDAPLHIGVTEAGTLISGLIKSTLGLSELLKKGIGNTIRISLSSDPINEVVAGWELLKKLGLRKGVEIISCPTCARTGINVIQLAERVEREFCFVNSPIKVAVMGCIVNGPGEAKEADIGIAGGVDCAALFVKGKVIRKVSEDEAFKELSKFINEHKVLEE